MSSWVCPHIVAVLKKLRDPQGISSLNIVVLIAGHVHIGLDRGSRGITLESHYRCLLCEVNRDKSDDSAF